MSKICALAQPTYLPWVGYFDIISRVDLFVLYDTAQFSRHSWQHRNQIRSRKESFYLNIPISRKSPLATPISRTVIADTGFVKKHLQSISQNLSKAEFFDEYFTEFDLLFRDLAKAKNLAIFNIELIKWFCAKLGIGTRIMLASEMPVTGSRSEYILEVCAYTDSKEYLSTAGSEDYLKEDIELFNTKEVSVLLHNYKHPVYPQAYPDFMPYMGIIDCLFNCGLNALKIIKSGSGEYKRLNDV